MTPFEIVFGLLTVIASLALTQVVAAAVNLIRHASSVRFSWLLTMWMWLAFATTIGNWGAMWGSRHLAAWPSWLVLLSLAMTIGQYAFSALVCPAETTGEPLDLRDFYRREKGKFIPAYLALVVFAILQNIALRDTYPAWFSDTVYSLVLGAFAVAALVSKSLRVQGVAATVLVATSIAFIANACNIGPA